MKVDNTGVVISQVTGADRSNLGAEFLCTWDIDGATIHIDRKVLEYLYSMHLKTKSNEIRNIEEPFL